MKKTGYAALLAFALCADAGAREAQATLHRLSVEGEAESVGTVVFTDTEYGLLITPALRGLEIPGGHGAHIHNNPNCGARPKLGRIIVGEAAGEHYDPKDTGRHTGPYGDGHMGDLPNLISEDDGRAIIPVLAPRLTVADLWGHSIIINTGPDHYGNYDNGPADNGSVRMYCGVIENEKT